MCNLELVIANQRKYKYINLLMYLNIWRIYVVSESTVYYKEVKHNIKHEKKFIYGKGKYGAL